MQQLVSYNKYIFFGVFLFRLWYALYFLVYGNDTISQQFAADQFLDGHGITHPLLTSTALDSLVYQPMAKWPLTLTLVQAFLYAMISDWITVAQVLTIVSVILFFWLVYKTVHLLGFSGQFQFITWVLLLTNPLLFHEFGVADWMGLAAYAGGFYCFSAFLKQPERRVIWLLAASFCLYLPAAFRYQYYPLVVFFPAFALYVSWKMKNPAAVKNAWLLSIGSAFFLLLQMGLFRWYAGGVENLFPQTSGWYWANLLQADPFVLKSVFRADYFIFKFPAYSGDIRSGFLFLSLILFLLAIVLIQGRKKAAAASPEQAVNRFLRMSILLIAGFFFLFLSLLSVKNPPVAFGFMNLNFVGETRYYSPVMYLLMLLLIWLLQENKNRILWRGSALLLLLCNTLLWVKFLINMPGLPAPVTQLRWAVQDRAVVKQAVQQAVPLSGTPIVLSWVPTEYILLNHFTEQTYILKDYRQLLTAELPVTSHFVFAAEKAFLKEEEQNQLVAKGFREVYRNDFYVVLLRKATSE